MQAWSEASSAWAGHILACDRCWLGKPCSDEPRLFAVVCERWATAQQEREAGAGGREGL